MKKFITIVSLCSAIALSQFANAYCRFCHGKQICGPKSTVDTLCGNGFTINGLSNTLDMSFSGLQKQGLLAP